MKSIKQTVITEFEISKSVFVNHLIPVTSVELAKKELEDIKTLYPDANHHCFCYIIGNNQEIQKYSDDGEPSKTAGLPMLEVLKKHELTNVLNVSIRYFGGIKLGTGGLVRAYTKSASNAILDCRFTALKTVHKIKISISFDLIGNVEKFIRDNHKLENTTYDTHVHYYFDILDVELQSLKNALQERTNGKADVVVLDTIEKFM
jgi:uncharacterized YigZ family protein